MALFDPALDLIPEYRGSRSYWLSHDNYLAAKALAASHPDVARRIERKVEELSEAHGARSSGKVEILFGEAREPLPFRRHRLIEVGRDGDAVIKTEIASDEALERHATFKLALALIAAEKLGAPLRERGAILDRLLSQEEPGGGLITDYEAGGKPVGRANVETTSLAILAVDASLASCAPTEPWPGAG